MATPPPDSDSHPEASAILCTYNRSHALARVLAALRSQTVSPDAFEIVVVDDGSTDDTAAVVAEAARHMPNLRFVQHDANRGTAASGNTGIAAARTDKLLFIDDDCIPDPSWVEAMAAALDDSPVVLGAIDSPRDGYVKLCHNVAQFYAFMPGEPAGPKTGIAGANMAFRRGVFDQVGGFDDTLRCASDMDMAIRARLRRIRLSFAPEALIVHDPDRVTLRDVFGYAASHAAATIDLRHKYWAVLQTPWVFAHPHLLLLASPFIALWVTYRVYTRTPRLFRLLRTAPVVFGLKIAWCWGAARRLLQRRREARS